MRTLFVFLCLPLVAGAHAVSISSGDLSFDGNVGHFVLRVPLYETAHLRTPETQLLQQISFKADGAPLQLAKSTCRADRSADQYICQAEYRVSATDVSRVDADNRLYEVLVPNHVHMLRVSRGELGGQAAFDQSFPQATIQLQAQSGAALAARTMLDGARAALSHPGLWLALVSLALAARSRRELGIFLAVLVAGECLIVLRRTDYLWKVSPYFIEAAVGLTIAYLAGEMLFFRHAGKRWVVVALLAVWLGCFLKVNYGATGADGNLLLAGFILAQLLSIALLYLLVRYGRRTRYRERLRQPAATSILAIGLIWFFWRWWS